MRLIDGLKLKGNPAKIPNASRDDLPQLFVDMGFKVGAEIGVEKGMFSEKLCRVGLTLYSIDPWRHDDGYKIDYAQEQFDSFFERTKKVLAPFPNSTIVRKTSMEAVKDFTDDSLDFVYIDANHKFRYIAQKILLNGPKRSKSEV